MDPQTLKPIKPNTKQKAARHTLARLSQELIKPNSTQNKSPEPNRPIIPARATEKSDKTIWHTCKITWSICTQANSKTPSEKDPLARKIRPANIMVPIKARFPIPTIKTTKIGYRGGMPGKSTTKPKPLNAKIIIDANIIETVNALRAALMLSLSASNFTPAALGSEKLSLKRSIRKFIALPQ